MTMSRILSLFAVLCILLAGTFVEAYLPKSFPRFQRGISQDVQSLIRTFLTTADFKNGMTMEIGNIILFNVALELLAEINILL
jgi:hypothetical protein